MRIKLKSGNTIVGHLLGVEILDNTGHQVVVKVEEMDQVESDNQPSLIAYAVLWVLSWGIGIAGGIILMELL
jgi:hypothetical protein